MRQNSIKWAMVLLPAIGLLLSIGFLFAAWVLCLILWFLCQLVVWSVDAYAWHSRRGKRLPQAKLTAGAQTAASKRNVKPSPIPAIPDIKPDIMPKWNAAHRRYVDRDLADWQEQFDALNHRP